METSSDPYINAAFTAVEFNVNTRDRGADKLTDQTQTCLSCAATEKCQPHIHRNNCLPQIHTTWLTSSSQHRAREHRAPAGPSVRLANGDGNYSIDDSDNDEDNVQSLTAVSVKDLPHQMKEETYANNQMKDESAKECLNYDDVDSRLPDVKGCVNDQYVMHILKNNVSKDWLKLNVQGVVEELPDEDTSDFPHLTQADILEKFANDRVVMECQILDRLRDIQLSNVEVLEQVSRSEPAVQRLLGRYQLSATDVKDLRVDEDIKSQVDKFLQTNVTGNLLLTRVLRENYSTFQSWLTAHLQVERQAGVARYRQALQIVDTQRRQRLGMERFLTHVANRVQQVLQTCGVTLSDNSETSTRETNCQQTVKEDVSRKNDSTIKQACSTVKSLPAANNVAHNQLLRKAGSPLTRCLDKSHSKSCIRSTYIGDLISTAGIETSIAEDTFDSQSDHRGHPTETSHCSTCGLLSGCCIAQPSTCGLLSGCCIAQPSTCGLLSGCCIAQPSTKSKRGRHSQTIIKDMTCAKDQSVNKLVCDLSPDEGTNLRCLISESLDRLSTVCERLVSDHMACFRMLALDPRLSLTETVWLSLNHRCQDSCWDKPEMDRQIEGLQQENRRLLTQVNVLQGRLVEKSAQLLSLQTRLEKCESLLKDTSPTTMTKCDTRELSRLNNSDIPRKANKLSYYVHKMCGNVPTLSPAAAASNASLSTSTGLYPVLQCSKITSNERTVICSKMTSKDRAVADSQMFRRTNPHFTASEEGTLPAKDSVRELTDKVQQLRIKESCLETVSTDRTHLAQCTDTAGLEAGKATHTHPHRNTHVRAGYTSGKEFKSWRHSLNSVQCCETLTAAKGHQLSEPMSRDTLQPAGQSDSLSVQETSLTEGQPDSLSEQTAFVIEGGSKSAQKTTAQDAQSAAAWTSSSENPNMESLTKTKHVSPTIASISESDKLQLGHRHKCTGGRSKQDKVHNELNVPDTSQDKERSQMTAKCVLQASVVSLASSLVNKSTPMPPRTRHPGRAALGKCLRCHKLFNWTDNHKLACSYHSQPLASTEKNKHGTIVQDLKRWRCCLQPENSQGCCFGQHI